MIIEFDPTGNEDNVNTLLRKYSTREILIAINKESNEIFCDKTELPGAERVTLPLYNTDSKRKAPYEAIVQSWSLLDLAYYAILWSNDYRGKSVDSREELQLLSVAIDNYKAGKEKEFLASCDDRDLLFYVWGLGGEQFKFETSIKVFDNLVRELYILFDNAVNWSENYDFDKIVKEETGVDWQDIVTSLLILWSGYTKESTLNKLMDRCIFKNAEKKTAFLKVVSYYTATYDEIRKSPIGRQHFYAKPFIETQMKEIVGLGPFLNLMVCEHCIFWILRNYFFKQKTNKQGFVNEFGYLFERYFEILLVECLDDNEYERIPEQDIKGADWKLKLGEYRLLVEQKSSILGTRAKQQETDVDTLKRFLSEKILEAVAQLHSTEDELGGGKYIKIILLYENYIQADILDNLFELPSCSVKNDFYFWIMTIEEMERLLWLYKTNKQKFRIVVDEKIRRETSGSKEGKSVEYILNQYDEKRNTFLEKDIFDDYRKIIKEGIREFLA